MTITWLGLLSGTWADKMAEGLIWTYGPIATSLSTVTMPTISTSTSYIRPSILILSLYRKLVWLVIISIRKLCYENCEKKHFLQNVLWMSIDVRFWRLKSVALLKKIEQFNGRRPIAYMYSNEAETAKFMMISNWFPWFIQKYFSVVRVIDGSPSRRWPSIEPTSCFLFRYLLPKCSMISLYIFLDGL